MAHNHDNHHHGHHHGSEGSWTEKNRAHWDKVASTYNSPERNREFGDLLNKITAFLLENITWIDVPFTSPSSAFESSSPSDKQRQVRVLDYACGPGTVTAALAGHATEYVGIDISENMVKEYNNRFKPSSSDTPTEPLNAIAVIGDLFQPSGPSPHLSDDKFFNFDLAVVSGGFHHFENVELATERLVERLKPGGVLLIFDFLNHAPDDLSDNPALHTVVHHGFGEQRVRELFGDAGLVDFDIKVMPEKVKLQGKAFRTGFLARARKTTGI